MFVNITIVFSQGPKYTLECILKLVAHLEELDREIEDAILYRVMQATCHIPRDQLNDSEKTPRLNSSDSDEEEEETFSSSQFLVFLRQYLYHLRLRIPGKRTSKTSAVSPNKPEHKSQLGSTSDEAEVERSSSPSPRMKHSNGDSQRSSRGKKDRSKVRKDSSESDEKDNMPVPAHRNNTLPPIF